MPYEFNEPDDVPEHQKKKFNYDLAGRLIETLIANPDTNNLCDTSYSYYYDDYGNMLAILDPCDRMTVFKYDEFHQQIAKYMPFAFTDPTGGDINEADIYNELATADPNAEYTDYDQFGRIEAHTDYKDQTTGYFYNDIGQLEYKRLYKSDANYVSDPNNNWDVQYKYTYDNLGRKTEVEEKDNPNSYTYTTIYTYDAEGRVYTIDTLQGEIGYGYNFITGRKDTILTPDTDIWVNVDTLFDYIYDELGRLKEVSVSKRNTVDLTDNSPAGEEERIIYEYNPVGSIDKIIRRVNGVDILTTEYSYDEMNRLESVTNKNSSQTTLSSFTYTIYADGQRKSVTELDGTVIDWTYDNLNRLETEDYNAPGTSNDYVHDYYYDLVGNRTQFDVDSVPQVYYFYSESDRLEKETSDSGGNNNLVSYLYDDNGSLTQADNGTVTTYTYNLQNRLDSVTEGVNPTVTYEYNPDGIRTQKKVGSAESINYLIDPYNHTGYAQVLKETQTGSDDIVFIIGHDVMAQATGTSSPVFMVYDGHGSVRQLADNTGSVISGQNFNYDSYGNILGSPTPQTNYLYAGEQYDSSLDWYYNRARYYNPSNGRFNKQDPFDGFVYEPQSLHKYLYVHDNPINYSDPSGMILWRPYWGMIVHRKIGRHFIDSSLKPRVSNIAINTILGTKLKLWGLDRPDLVDISSQEVYEIKPLGLLSVGQAQLGWYLLLMNTFDPAHRLWKPGITYFPKPVIDVTPTTIAVVSPPVGGVIQYEIIDTPTIISAVIAYEAYQFYMHLKMIQLRTAVLRVPL